MTLRDKWTPVMIDLTPRIRQGQAIDAMLDVCAMEVGQACPWPVSGYYAERACDGCRRHK